MARHKLVSCDGFGGVKTVAFHVVFNNVVSTTHSPGRSEHLWKCSKQLILVGLVPRPIYVIHVQKEQATERLKSLFIRVQFPVDLMCYYSVVLCDGLLIFVQFSYVSTCNGAK